MNKIFEAIRRLFGVTTCKEVEIDEKLARHKDFCDELADSTLIRPPVPRAFGH